MKTYLKVFLFITLPVWIVPAILIIFWITLWDSFSEMADKICREYKKEK